MYWEKLAIGQVCMMSFILTNDIYDFLEFKCCAAADAGMQGYHLACLHSSAAAAVAARNNKNKIIFQFSTIKMLCCCRCGHAGLQPCMPALFGCCCCCCCCRCCCCCTCCRGLKDSRFSCQNPHIPNVHHPNVHHPISAHSTTSPAPHFASNSRAKSAHSKCPPFITAWFNQSC